MEKILSTNKRNFLTSVNIDVQGDLCTSSTDQCIFLIVDPTIHVSKCILYNQEMNTMALIKGEAFYYRNNDCFEAESNALKQKTKLPYCPKCGADFSLLPTVEENEKFKAEIDQILQAAEGED